MRRIRALVILAAVVASAFGGLILNASPAKAAPHGYMTCHLNVLDEDWTPTERVIECYY